MMLAVDIERRQLRMSDEHDSGLRPQSAMSFTHTNTLAHRLHTAPLAPLLSYNCIVICECDCAFGDASGDIRGGFHGAVSQRAASLTGLEDRANTAAPLSRNCSHVDVSMFLLTGQLVPPTRCTSSLAAGESLGEALYVLMC